MTLLELVITAHRCRSTHHFIAIDALSLLRGEHAEGWKALLLRHHTALLSGAKAPDDTFKDFQNHVLHVQEGQWGGARDAAMDWYGKAVDYLRREKWKDAAYALGVLTHYYADPIQPFHTGQTEEEGAIHRALEWSIAKSRDTLKGLIDQRGYPEVKGGSNSGFVADMVLAGATYSNRNYQTLIDHYNLDKGVIDPPAGLDQTLLDLLADLIAYATAGVATLFERAFAESGAVPKPVDLDLPGYLAALDIPIRKLTARMADANDRRTVERMYAELKTTGKVIKTLPDDDKAVRKLHARQVLRKPLSTLDIQPLKPLGTKHVPLAAHPRPVTYALRTVPILKEQAKGEPARPALPRLDLPASASVPDEPPAISAPLPGPDPAPPAAEIDIENKAAPSPEDTTAEAEHAKSVLTASLADTPEPAVPSARLTLDSPVVDAPSIGPKTASRFESIEIYTVGDLLKADAEATAIALNVRYITPQTLTDWQDQTRLMVTVPGLRVLDSQILVGAGIRTAADLKKASANKVLSAALSFLDTPNGARILWGNETKVNESEVAQWIDLARKSHG